MEGIIDVCHKLGGCMWVGVVDGFLLECAQPVGILAQGCAPDPDFPTHPHQSLPVTCDRVLQSLIFLQLVGAVQVD